VAPLVDGDVGEEGLHDGAGEADAVEVAGTPEGAAGDPEGHDAFGVRVGEAGEGGEFLDGRRVQVQDHAVAVLYEVLGDSLVPVPDLVEKVLARGRGREEEENT
jgi:hypothetical protein